MPNFEREIVFSTDLEQKVLGTTWVEGEKLLKEIFKRDDIWENSPIADLPTICNMEMRPMTLDDASRLMKAPSFRVFSQIFSDVGFFNYSGAITLEVMTLNNRGTQERTMCFSFRKAGGLVDGSIVFYLTKRDGEVESGISIDPGDEAEITQTLRIGQKLKKLAVENLLQTVPLIDLLELFKEGSLRQGR